MAKFSRKKAEKGEKVVWHVTVLTFDQTPPEQDNILWIQPVMDRTGNPDKTLSRLSLPPGCHG